MSRPHHKCKCHGDKRLGVTDWDVLSDLGIRVFQLEKLLPRRFAVKSLKKSEVHLTGSGREKIVSMYTSIGIITTTLQLKIMKL
jgi:hypothetical protein